MSIIIILIKMKLRIFHIFSCERWAGTIELQAVEISSKSSNLTFLKTVFVYNVIKSHLEIGDAKFRCVF